MASPCDASTVSTSASPRSATILPVKKKNGISADDNGSPIASIPLGTWFWIADETFVWKKAKLIQKLPTERDGVLTVQCQYCDNTFGTFEASTADCFYLCNTIADNKINADDLADLTHLHEPDLLEALESRFFSDSIYTFTGPILIAVNPFKQIPNLYDKKALDGVVSCFSQPKTPHVYSVANRAFRNLCISGRSQTILLSGESGAGKTESTKHVMRCLAVAGSYGRSIKQCSARHAIEQRMIQSNPLLESLGNATTLRNHNSSRFGKFVEMRFTPPLNHGEPLPELTGARIETYLLETTRVCRHAQGERNYHIFYQLCAAASWAKKHTNGLFSFQHPSLATRSEHSEIESPALCDHDVFVDLSFLKPADTYRYLKLSLLCDDVDDQGNFFVTLRTMTTVGISKEEQVTILRVLGAVLCLGNLVFDAASDDSVFLQPSSKSLLQVLAVEGLGLPDESLLEEALTHRVIQTVGELFRKPFTLREADDNRDAFAKALYDTLFARVVDYVNEAATDNASENAVFCGVLDIFGFECFELNSLEQLCINYTNERLQSVFNDFVFESERKLYEREGIPWIPVMCVTNEQCLDFLDHRTVGFFALLEEECILPEPNDQRLLHKLGDKHKNHACFSAVPLFWRERFAVTHFAGRVLYDITGFTEKNSKRCSFGLHRAALQQSNKSFVRSLFQHAGYCEGGAQAIFKHSVKQTRTVASVFHQQLDALIRTLEATDPFFVRCIKPNSNLMPGVFDRRVVVEQLRYSGMVQAVHVSRANFPVRLPHNEAYALYRCLASPAFCEQFSGLSPFTRSTRLFEHLSEKLLFSRDERDWALGTSFLFLRRRTYEALEQARVARIAEAQKALRRCWLGYCQRKQFKIYRENVISLQACFRGWYARKRYLYLKRDVCVLQEMARVVLSKARCRTLRNTVVQLQALTRQRFAIFFLQQEKHHQERQSLTQSPALNAKPASRRCPRRRRKAQALGILDRPRVYQTRRLQRENATLKSALSGVKKQLNAVIHQRDSLATQLQRSSLPSADTPSVLGQESYISSQRDIGSVFSQSPRSNEQFSYSAAALTSRTESWTSRKIVVDILMFGRELKNNNCFPFRNSGLPTNAPHHTSAAADANAFITWEALDNTYAIDGTSISIIKCCCNGHQWVVGYSDAMDDSMLEDSASFFTAWFGVPLYLVFIYDPATPDDHDTVCRWLMSSAAPTAQRVVWAVADSTLLEDSVAQCATTLNVPVIASTLFLEVVVQLVALGVPRQQEVAAEEQSSLKILYLNVAAEPSNASSLLSTSFTLSQALSSFAQFFNPSRLGKSASQSNHSCAVPAKHLVLNVSLSESSQISSISDPCHPNNIKWCLTPLRPIVEVRALPGVVSCLEFDRFTHPSISDAQSSYSFLAAGFSNGWLCLYRVFWTALECSNRKEYFSTSSPFTLRQMPSCGSLGDHPYGEPKIAINPQGPRIELHWERWAHRDKVSELTFHGTSLVTSGAAGYIRFWDIFSGENTKNFYDTAGCNSFAFFKTNPKLMVVANANYVMRVVDVTTGRVLQRFRTEHLVTALKFDTTGTLCFAGTFIGSVAVMEVQETGNLHLKYCTSATKSPITSVTYIEATPMGSHPACLLVTAKDSGTSLVECYFGSMPAEKPFHHLSVRQQIVMSKAPCCQRSAYSAAGEGWFICPADVGKISLISMTSRQRYKIKHNKLAHVTAVAVNVFNTVLASADEVGRILLWRSIGVERRRAFASFAIMDS